MQFENRPPELQIFSIEGSIENLMKEYEMAVRNKQFERAQEIVEEINNLDKQKIEIQQGTKTNQIQNIKSILNAGTLGMTPGKDMGGRPIRMEADMVKKSQEEMGDLSKFGMKDGGEASFPDLNNDGETTYADVLVGRGVEFAEGGEAIDDEIAGMEMGEEDAMAEIQSIAPQTKMIEQLVMAVMQMVQQGIGEQEIINFLKEQGLDDEDIEDLFTMVMQQMQQGQQDPIASELQEMS